jgi:Family of unknown function (DUF5329)
MPRFKSAPAALILVPALLLSPPTVAASLGEEIDHLLDFIAASPCTFIRNGVAYGGEQAADHIKEKYEHYREDIHSAEEFIALAATKSALSGRPYLVQCDANPVPAAEWLSRELAAFRQRP